MSSAVEATLPAPRRDVDPGRRRERRPAGKGSCRCRTHSPARRAAGRRRGSRPWAAHPERGEQAFLEQLVQRLSAEMLGKLAEDVVGGVGIVPVSAGRIGRPQPALRKDRCVSGQSGDVIEQMLDLIMLPLGNGIVGSRSLSLSDSLKRPFLRHLVGQDRRHHLADRADLEQRFRRYLGLGVGVGETEVEDGAEAARHGPSVSPGSPKWRHASANAVIVSSAPASFGGGCCAAAGTPSGRRRRH